ncbi:MAG: exosome complex RNA-binding protein Rrp4 [Halobacteriota archaeon]
MKKQEKVDKTIVVPGDLLSEDAAKAAEGTYVENGKVYSLIYGLADEREKVRVIPLSGKYLPATGDVVVGMVSDISFSNWKVDINSPYEALMHISEYPRRIESSEMAKIMGVGDLAIFKVVDVDPSMKIELTPREGQLRVLRSGRVVEVSYTKVPRIIGRAGSMISLLKSKLDVNIFVGKNGRIWINGKVEDEDLAVKVIKRIEQEAHTSGLTDRITKLLEEEKHGVHEKR